MGGATGIAAVTLAEVFYMVGGRVSPNAPPEMVLRIRTAANEDADGELIRLLAMAGGAQSVQLVRRGFEDD